MRLALTGTIGSGKSTASNYFRSKGFEVFSCDDYNAKMLLKGQEGYEHVKGAFPECFINDELSKKELSKIVFNNEEKRKLLESIMHPLIVKKMESLASETDLFIAEVPLLFESGLEKMFDVTILVVTDEEIALKRLEERGLTQEEAKLRIAAQMSISDKKKRADEIIYNNSNLSNLNRDLDRIIKKYAG